MQHTELLHRLFDEGLEESLEDVLFEQMATNAELRKEFLEHLRLHSIVQEDAAGITTPSHVSQELFINLGLTPPGNYDINAPAGFRKQIAALAIGMRAFIVEHQRYLYTAALSSLATVLIIYGLNTGSEKSESNTQERREATTETRPDRAAALLPPTLPAKLPATPPVAGNANHLSSAAQLRGGDPMIAGSADVNSGSFGMTNATVAIPGMESARSLFSLESSLANHADNEIVARAIMLNDIPAPLPEERLTERHWHFFQPGPRTNVLSNMVFELQKLYGTSYPDVDLPHNSHTLFENMALSAIYKVTEHHAFGFEYGRENFGREFQSTEMLIQTPLDVSVQEMFSPPAASMSVETRENRMLDVFGAVWKLSLPDYGVRHFVYPYMRTFVGATRLGPLGKVRLGLEMYPSNFSALNIGIEGGLFRYTVDESAYYTTKVNVIFGVAIGF